MHEAHESYTGRTRHRLGQQGKPTGHDLSLQIPIFYILDERYKKLANTINM